MSRKTRIIVGAILAALFAANHAEHYFRLQRIRRQALDQDVPVVQVANSAAGHSSIQIDEQSLGRGQFLHFSTLESWSFAKETPTTCPAAVQEANGKLVKIMGFMYPLQEADKLKVFCLLRSTQTCCYGPRPQYNQYVFVEMPEAVKFERLAPVVVEGKFFVDPRPDDGYIYRMEGVSARPAGGGDQPVVAEDYARSKGLGVFDFAALEAVPKASDKEAAIAGLQATFGDKPLVVHGFIVGRTKDKPPKIKLGKYAWDGLSKGTPPNLYNTVLVTVRSLRDVPPMWWQEAVMDGTIRVTREAESRRRDGVVALTGATLAGAPSVEGPLVDGGPLLPVLYEVAILAAYAGMFLPSLMSLWRTKKTRRVADKGKS